MSRRAKSVRDYSRSGTSGMTRLPSVLWLKVSLPFVGLGVCEANCDATRFAAPEKEKIDADRQRPMRFRCFDE